MKYVVSVSLLIIALLGFFLIQTTGKVATKDSPFGDSLDYYIDKFENVIDIYAVHDVGDPHEFEKYEQEGVMYNFPSYLRPNYSQYDGEMRKDKKIKQVDSLVKVAKTYLEKKDVMAFHDFLHANWKHFVFHPANNLENEQNFIDMMMLISRECYSKEETAREGIEYYEWYIKHLNLTEVYSNGRVRKVVDINPRRPLATFSLMEYYRMDGQINSSIAKGEELLYDLRIALPDDNDLMYECASELARYYRMNSQNDKAEVLVKKYKLIDFV